MYIINHINLRDGFAAGLLPYQIIRVRGQVTDTVIHGTENLVVKIGNENVLVPMAHATRIPKSGETYRNARGDVAKVVIATNIDEEAVFDNETVTVVFTKEGHTRSLSLEEFNAIYGKRLS